MTTFALLIVLAATMLFLLALVGGVATAVIMTSKRRE
jgi:hypothetical protein